MCVARLTIVASVYLIALTWYHIPLCAAYQYIILGRNGDYKYGYRTDDGIVVRQEADRRNQVSGQYYYRNNLGNFGIQYPSGDRPADSSVFNLQYPYPQRVGQSEYVPNANVFPQSRNLRTDNSADTDNYRQKREHSDPYGNTLGHFRYESDNPRRLARSSVDSLNYHTTVSSRQNPGPNFPFNNMWNYQSQFRSNPNEQLFLTPYYLIDWPVYFGYWPYYSGTNRNYNFSFDTGNYRKKESSDSRGNVRGYFEYVDDLGRHDLSYTANDRSGFHVTGGNLAERYPEYHQRSGISGTPHYLNINRNVQNGASGQLDYLFSNAKDSTNPYLMSSLRYRLQDLSKYLNNFVTSLYNLPYSDRHTRSYYFLFDTGKYKIEESSHPGGGIRGYFQYGDTRGFHDLSYRVDEKNGFQVIGGNLASEVSKSRAEKGSEPKSSEENDDEIVFQVGKETERPDNMQ